MFLALFLLVLGGTSAMLARAGSLTLDWWNLPLCLGSAFLCFFMGIAFLMECVVDYNTEALAEELRKRGVGK